MNMLCFVFYTPLSVSEASRFYQPIYLKIQTAGIAIHVQSGGDLNANAIHSPRTNACIALSAGSETFSKWLKYLISGDRGPKIIH